MDTEERKRITQEAKQIMKGREKICANCGTEFGIQVHHIVPVSQGGGNRGSNLVFLCKECHKKAHAYVGGRVKEHEDYLRVHRLTTRERMDELKERTKRFKVTCPYLFESFKEYVGLLSANDPSVLDKNDIATMNALMMYRELGMSQREFLEMIMGAGEEIAESR